MDHDQEDLVLMLTSSINLRNKILILNLEQAVTIRSILKHFKLCIEIAHLYLKEMHKEAKAMIHRILAHRKINLH